jgi:hypothetical protein
MYEDALAAGKAEPAEMQLLLIIEVIADNAAGFAAMLGVRNPRLNISRIVCPELPIWEVLDWDVMTLVDLVFAMGAREITRLLLGFFEVVPTVASLICALASGDEELIRELWVHAPDEVRVRRVGGWLKTAAALQLEAPFRWLLGLANVANLDRAVELMVDDRLVGAVCEVEAAGFDMTRTRPARALARWSRTMWRVVRLMPSFRSVPASTLLAWHVRELRNWDIPCDTPGALAMGQVVWVDPAPRIDLLSLTTGPAKRVLFLGQTLDGVVFGTFTNCPLSGGVQRMDRALKSAIFVLEHPTGQQRKWRLQNPHCAIGVTERFLCVGAGFCVGAVGFLYVGRAREFGMTEVDASFIGLAPAVRGVWSAAQNDRWELWSV